MGRLLFNPITFLLSFAGVVLATTAQTAPPDSYPVREPHRILRSWTGASPTESFGFKIRDLGDLDGDGVHDFAMAATGRDNGLQAGAGAIDIYSTATGRLLHSYPGHFLRGHFGNGIGFAGDVDGDGSPDIVAGSYDDEKSKTGYAVIFAAGNGLTYRVLRSGRSGDWFGLQAHGTGDLDGDGYDDVVIGAPTDDTAGPVAGRAYFFSGRTGRILFTLEGDRPGDRFGSAVTGDVYDRSGLFAIGAREAGPDSRGRVYVYRVDGGQPSRLFTVEPLETSHELGAYFLSFLGDVDADGTPDVYAGDYADSAHGEESGRVHVLSGRTGERLLNLEGRSEWGGFGTGYGRVGDVDHDGHADVLVGSWRNGDGAEAGGAAFLYSGRDGRLLSTFTGRFAGRTFGHDAIGIGDVDGDGAIDLLITNAGNSGVLPRATGHVYLFSGGPEVNAIPIAPRSARPVPSWARVLEWNPDPTVVRDPSTLRSMEATGAPWRVVHEESGVEMLLVPPGSYMRGAADDDPFDCADERPQHRVEITRPFYLGRFEVTNAQIRRFRPDHNSGAFYRAPSLTLDDDDMPAVDVSWLDVSAFADRFGFRLPTEAEWEYAARAGVTTRYPWGNETAPARTATPTASRTNATRAIRVLDGARRARTPARGWIALGCTRPLSRQGESSSSRVVARWLQRSDPA